MIVDRPGTCSLCGTFQKRLAMHHVRCRQATPEERERYLLTGKWGRRIATSCSALIYRLLRDHPEGLTVAELKASVCETFAEGSFRSHWPRVKRSCAKPLGDGRWTLGRIQDRPHAPSATGGNIFRTGRREHQTLLAEAARELPPLEALSSSDASSILQDWPVPELGIEPGASQFFCERRQETLPTATCLEDHINACGRIVESSPCFGCVDGWRRRLHFANDEVPSDADVDGAISDWLVGIGRRAASYMQWAKPRGEDVAKTSGRRGLASLLVSFVESSGGEATTRQIVRAFTDRSHAVVTNMLSRLKKSGALVKVKGGYALPGSGV